MDAIRSRSRWLKWLATVVLAVLVFGLCLEIAMILRGGNFASGLRWTVPYRLPLLFYIAAVWVMRQAFAQLERGALFDRMLPALLTRIGLALAAGGVASVFLTPWLWRLLCGPRLGAYAAFDPPAIAVGLVGLLLVILGRLLVRASAMRRELDGIL
jgi:hypothetical protein